MQHESYVQYWYRNIRVRGHKILVYSCTTSDINWRSEDVCKVFSDFALKHTAGKTSERINRDMAFKNPSENDCSDF